MVKTVSRVVLTPEFRGSYVNVIEPTEFREPGKPPSGKWAYTSEMIFTEDSLTKFRVDRDGTLVFVDIRKILEEIALEAWPELAGPAQPGQQFTPLQLAFIGPLSKGWPLRKGDQVADKALRNAAAANKPPPNVDHYRGNRVIAAKSNVTPKTQPPALAHIVKGNSKPQPLNRAMPSDMQSAKPLMVGGNHFVAEINLKATEVGGLKFIVPYLNAFTYTREGAKFGFQGGALMSRFEGVAGGESSHDPTAGLDAEIPF